MGESLEKSLVSVVEDMKNLRELFEGSERSFHQMTAFTLVLPLLPLSAPIPYSKVNKISVSLSRGQC